MELQTAVTELKKIMHDHDASVDEQLKQKAEKGYVDTLIEERTDRIQKDLFAKLDAIKLANDETNRRFEDAMLFSDRKSDKEDDKIASAFIKQLKAESGSRDLSKEFGPKELQAYRKAIDSYWRGGDQAMSPAMVADMQVGVQSDGGYWVTPDATGRVSAKVFETSPMRQVASVQTISTDSLKGPVDTGEADAGWVGETETRAKTNSPTIGEWQIFVHEMYAQPYCSQKLLDDAMIDAGAWLERKISEKFARIEAAAFISGDGNKKPRGILAQTAVSTGDATRPWGSVQYLVSGASGAFLTTDEGLAYTKLTEVLVSLKSAYRSGAVWLMNRATLGVLMKDRDADGRPLWQPNLSDNAFNINLLGYRVVDAEDMPDLASDSYSIAFGNFNEAYQIVDRIGIRILRDPYTLKPFVKFYATKRTGGDAVNREAYKILKFGTS